MAAADADVAGSTGAAAMVTVVVQVNGKVRGTLELSRATLSLSPDALSAHVQATAVGQRALRGRTPVRTIVARDKVINFVVPVV